MVIVLINKISDNYKFSDTHITCSKIALLFFIVPFT